MAGVVVVADVAIKAHLNQRQLLSRKAITAACDSHHDLQIQCSLAHHFGEK
jgi:hypothetical protein